MWDHKRHYAVNLNFHLLYPEEANIYIQIHTNLSVIIDFPSGSAIKNLPANAGDVGSVSGWEFLLPWRRKCQASPVFLPEKSHGWRNLTSYSPWGSHRVRYDLATEHGHMHVPSSSAALLYQGQAFLFLRTIFSSLYNKFQSSISA